MVLRQISHGGPHDSLPLAAVDRVDSAPEPVAAPAADLDEHERVSMCRDEIELAGSGPNVTREDHVPSPAEIIRRRVFRALPEISARIAHG